MEYLLNFSSIPDGKILIVNATIPVHTFHLQDIYDRYAILGKYVIDNTIPPRDYTYGYSMQESEERCKVGKITKSKLAKVKASQITDSDWNCLYCSHLDTCYKEKRNAMKANK